MNIVYKETPADLCLYQNVSEDPRLAHFTALLDARGTGANWTDEYRKLKKAVFAAPERSPLAPTVWKDALVRLMLSENPTNKKLEAGTQISHNDVLLHEMSLFSQFYNFDWQSVSAEAGDELDPLGTVCYEAGSPLSEALKAGKPQEILNALTGMIRTRGLGVFSSAKLFRLDEDGDPIPCVPGRFKPMEEIIGCDSQKEKIIRNTQALISGAGALNALLYGDMGTGKSSMVKALTLMFENTPLRFIEIHKGEFGYFRKLFARIRETNYPFIIFIDDLSFEAGDEDYKSMKNALEGSFEDIPNNLAIYATSNRRGLVSQSQSERKDAVNAREILEEKLSLLSRFGLTLQFSAPPQDDYLAIVHALAEKNEIDIENEILEEQALKWALRHLNRSGRTAEQFVVSLMAGSIDENMQLQTD